MRYIVTLMVLLTFCFSQTKEEALHDAKVRQEARAELLLELQQQKLLKSHNPTIKETKQPFNKIGLTINKDMIILDTNKTTNFFQNLTLSLESKFKQIQKELQSTIKDPKKIGIDINNEHINIDINTSSNYLKELEKKMQGFVKEFDNIAKEFDEPLH